MSHLHFHLQKLSMIYVKLVPVQLLAVFRIRDILERARIRIRGSVPLTNGSGSGSFRQWPSRHQQKFSLFFLLIPLRTFWRHIYIILQRVTKPYGRNNDFSYYFCLIIEGSGSVHLTYGSGTGRPKNIQILRIRNTGCWGCKLTKNTSLGSVSTLYQKNNER